MLKTKAFNRKEIKFKGILVSNIGSNLKRPKSDEKVKFEKFAKKLKDTVERYLVSICVSKRE